MLTLPYPGGDLADIWAAWRLLVKRVRREYGELEYCGVRARGKEHGLVHVHAAVAGPYIPQAWLSEQWRELTGYAVVDIRALKVGDGDRVARYVARQVGGYLTDQAVAEGGRLLESQGWLPARVEAG